MDICASGLRAGLCHEEFSTGAAIVLCRQLGFNTHNPGLSSYIIIRELAMLGIMISLGITSDDTRRFAVFSDYNCTGNEQAFRECEPRRQIIGPECLSARLNCSS